VFNGDFRAAFYAVLAIEGALLFVQRVELQVTKTVVSHQNSLGEFRFGPVHERSRIGDPKWTADIGVGSLFLAQKSMTVGEACALNYAACTDDDSHAGKLRDCAYRFFQIESDFEPTITGDSRSVSISTMGSVAPLTLQPLQQRWRAPDR
jgi:hypothetical protein